MFRIILIIACALGLITMIFNGYISYEFVNNFSKGIEEKNKKLDEIFQFQRYLSALKDAETGERGYVITGNKAYLEPYESAIKFVNSPETKAFLEKAEKENTINDDVKQLRKLAHTKIEELQYVIDKYDTLGFKAAQEAISSNLGKNTMDQIRTIAEEISLEKQNFLLNHEIKMASNLSFLINLIVSINILYICLISICLYTLYKETTKT